MIVEPRQWIRRHPRVADSTLAVLLFAVTLVSTTWEQPPHVRQWPPLPALAVSALSAGMFLQHRRHPRLTLVATTTCSTVLGVLAPASGYQFGSTVASTAMAALVSLAWRTDQRTTGRYTAVCVLTLFAASAVRTSDGIHVQPDEVGLVAIVLLAAAVADSARSRRDYVAAVEARAELAERTREDEARHRVAAERMRIARELHDVVAHHITLAHAQAATADYLLTTRPDRAGPALSHLVPTLATALKELRATVGLLRHNGHNGGPEGPLEPAPGLARLPALLASFAHAGLTVHRTDDGPGQQLTPGVDLTAFRIIQESLTNVTKHAGTPAAWLRLTYTGDLLTITVSDDGPPRTVADTAVGHGLGYGLIGMRERARAAGGRLRAGPRPDHGFEVIAELPTGTARPARPSLTDHEDVR
ncbi:sensor histidine kinase [Streptomyces sp. ME03-5684b]|uniref:sensor histidine kinase n=1 Tax=Streptomyces sp. ME03-5684b TaxID=3028681 RepID=UPI0029B22FD4|nr:sensor histidine kinase [Streptomyces sp. ME03-5684b]MDX3323049.1 sensor histidine kinase [Streptomyces sp. ME03-5684b]